jgi:hypothetical protein
MSMVEMKGRRAKMMKMGQRLPMVARSVPAMMGTRIPPIRPTLFAHPHA